MTRFGSGRVRLTSVMFLLGAFSGVLVQPESSLAPDNVSGGSLLLLQKPTMSRTHIVFAHASDLWSVPRDGGEATRLTVGSGIETNPFFSPDGSQIAFSGEYDGSVDVFVMPAAGGTPKRLTWHPAADNVLGWSPDGKRILFGSMRNSYSRFAELFTVDLEGHFPSKVDLPMGFEGAYSPDGSQLAYVPVSRAFNAWKRYRGGLATPVWIANLSTGRIAKVPRTDSNDFNPMWIGQKIYFLSDRNGPATLFSYDPQTKQVKQLVDNRGLDLKSAGAGPEGIVYEQFGALHTYDLNSGKSKPLAVRLTADLLELRPRMVDISRRLRNAHISPSGARAVFEGRGEIISVPAEKGDPRNLTNSPDVMEREPVWSPDGKTIAYFSDESGAYELHLRPQSGLGEVKRVKLGEQPGFYFGSRWSPDSKNIAFVDNHQTIWYVNLDEAKAVRVDKDPYWTWGGSGDLNPVWSPDSKWLAYARRLGSNKIESVVSGVVEEVTLDAPSLLVHLFPFGARIHPDLNARGFQGAAGRTGRGGWAGRSRRCNHGSRRGDKPLVVLAVEHLLAVVRKLKIADAGQCHVGLLGFKIVAMHGQSRRSTCAKARSFESVELACLCDLQGDISSRRQGQRQDALSDVLEIDLDGNGFRRT